MEVLVSILILLDYLFLYCIKILMNICVSDGFNPYFTGLPILIFFTYEDEENGERSFNPYFTGLPILIRENLNVRKNYWRSFQSLFYWITYSY